MGPCRSCPVDATVVSVRSDRKLNLKRRRYEWDPVPQRFHVQWMQLKPYFIDKHPVTQSQWETYLNSGGEIPTDTWHYLHDWDWTSAVPKPRAGNESKPVVYIGLDEARAYCASLGKRLPREEEWQFAVRTVLSWLHSIVSQCNSIVSGCALALLCCISWYDRVKEQICPHRNFRGARF